MYGTVAKNATTPISAGDRVAARTNSWTSIEVPSAEQGDGPPDPRRHGVLVAARRREPLDGGRFRAHGSCRGGSERGTNRARTAPTCDHIRVDRLRVFARHLRTVVVVVVMLAATLLAPVALPVSLIVRWMRRDDHRIEHVVSAPNVALLVPRDRSAGEVSGGLR
jgi:hypothetical protein